MLIKLLGVLLVQTLVNCLKSFTAVGHPLCLQSSHCLLDGPSRSWGKAGKVFLLDSCSSHILKLGSGMEYVVTGSVMSASWVSMTMPVMISLTV